VSSAGCRADRASGVHVWPVACRRCASRPGSVSPFPSRDVRDCGQRRRPAPLEGIYRGCAGVLAPQRGGRRGRSGWAGSPPGSCRRRWAQSAGRNARNGPFRQAEAGAGAASSRVPQTSSGRSQGEKDRIQPEGHPPPTRSPPSRYSCRYRRFSQRYWRATRRCPVRIGPASRSIAGVEDHDVGAGDGAIALFGDNVPAPGHSPAETPLATGPRVEPAEEGPAYRRGLPAIIEGRCEQAAIIGRAADTIHHFGPRCFVYLAADEAQADVRRAASASQASTRQIPSASRSAPSWMNNRKPRGENTPHNTNSVTLYRSICQVCAEDVSGSAQRPCPVPAGRDPCGPIPRPGSAR